VFRRCAIKISPHRPALLDGDVDLAIRLGGLLQ
jgi:hypothetical protein